MLQISELQRVHTCMLRYHKGLSLSPSERITTNCVTPFKETDPYCYTTPRLLHLLKARRGRRGKLGGGGLRYVAVLQIGFFIRVARFLPVSRSMLTTLSIISLIGVKVGKESNLTF